MAVLPRTVFLILQRMTSPALVNSNPAGWHNLENCKMKIRSDYLIGVALDWFMAKAEGIET